jgi:hypothetical protein
MKQHWATTKIPGFALASIVIAASVIIAPCCTSRHAASSGTSTGVAPTAPTDDAGTCTATVGDLRTTNLLVDQRATENQVSYGPAIQDGLLDFEVIYNDWNPAGLHTNGVVFMEAADNSGAVVTGMDATGFKDGDVVTLCNFNGHMDASSIGFPNLDSRSLQANQFFVPNGGKTDDPSGASTLWAKIGVDECQDVMRASPIRSDPTLHYWVFKGARGRTQDLVMGRMQLFPQMNTAAVTGTVNDWNPTPAGPFTYTCALNPGPGTAPCNLDGSPVTNQAASVVYVNTATGAGAVLTGYKYYSGPAGDLGPVVYFVNLGPGLLTFKDHGTSVSLNQFNIEGDGSNSLVLRVGGIVGFFHPNDSGYWYQIGHNDAVFATTFVQAKDGIIVSQGADGFALSIQGGTSVIQGGAVVDFADTASTVMVDGHMIENGTHPVASPCGSGPVTTGNDTAGTVTVGSGTTSCKLTFHRTMGNPPPCTYNDDAGLPLSAVRTATDITWSSASLAGTTITWICPSPAS